MSTFFTNSELGNSGIRELRDWKPTISPFPNFLLPLLFVLIAGCRHAPLMPAAAHVPPAVRFVDVTTQAGIRFRHNNGASGKKWLPETMGSGCGFLDYDNDGWLDILFVNGKPLDVRTSERSNVQTSKPSTVVLYRNDRDGTFTDVTRDVGLRVDLYGMGVAVGDYDNDGFDDVYVTGLGGGRLLRNRAGKRFEDVTERMGVEGEGWATSAAWVDYNRDGWLDLFVCHYVKWTPQTDVYWSLDGVHKSYTTPEKYEGESCRLYRNDGSHFTDVTKAAGIYSVKSKALGVAICDYDQDGQQDIIVANDTEPNFLFHNQGDGTFKEVGIEAGIAVSEQGKARAGMGIDTADDLNSGQEAILITNFAGEQLSYYRKDETGHYLDHAAACGLGAASQMYLGFGAFFFDYDLDGWQDIFVCNGHVMDDIEVRNTGVTYAEPCLLFHNNGRGAFTEVGRESGVGKRIVGRGAAFGDYDNDGDLDLLITTNNGAPRLLRNDNRTDNGYIRLILEGTHSNRSAIGARVRVRVGHQTLMLCVKSGSSYLSASDRRLTFGLGKAPQADGIEIQWPNGNVQTLDAVPAGQTVRVKEET
ncbi:MAG: CRTAC1 family protein [Abditibacteriales bacterium]|nr:CRTAC1 family protein [Abditibacteriales bacterium]MDW8366376.1 CRTAC1 family protein [Abditibacteriales bacterium]